MKTAKQECSKEPFTFDWASFFELIELDPTVTPITSSVWELTGDLVSLGEDTTGANATILLGGGVAGTTAQAMNTIEVAGGRYRDCRTLYIDVT